MNAELKSLIEDAAALLGYKDFYILNERAFNQYNHIILDPLNQESGDLEKLMEAAELCINYKLSEVHVIDFNEWCIKHEETFTKGDHQSKVLAILRAASAVLHSRGGV